MMTKEQFEKFEKEVKEVMEEYSVKAKMLNTFNGDDLWGGGEIDTCSLDIRMSTTLADELIEYAKSNFNTLQKVMDRIVEPNEHNKYWTDEQGYIDDLKNMHFYDGIFSYEFKGNKLRDVYFKFTSIGVKGAYYSKRFWLNKYESDELEWNIELTFRQRSKAKNYSEKEQQPKGKRIMGRRLG